MGVIDIVIVCCFLPVLYFGIKNGLVKQLVAFAVVYFGIRLSLHSAGSSRKLSRFPCWAGSTNSWAS